MEDARLGVGKIGPENPVHLHGVGKKCYGNATMLFGICVSAAALTL